MLEVKETYNHKNYNVDEKLTLLELFDGGEPSGYIAFNIEGTGENKSVYIKELKCNDSLLSDFLVRSAAAYGDNRFCFTLVSEDSFNNELYKKLGFSENDGKNSLPISRIVHKTQNN